MEREEAVTMQWRYVLLFLGGRGLGLLGVHLPAFPLARGRYLAQSRDSLVFLYRGARYVSLSSFVRFSLTSGAKRAGQVTAPEWSSFTPPLTPTYRTFALKRPLRISWRQLYRQFGATQPKASDKNTVNRFRTHALRDWQRRDRMCAS